MVKTKSLFWGIISMMSYIIIGSCGGEQYVYQPTPVDSIIKKLNNEPSFSIILYDMDYIESPEQFKHSYIVLINRPDTVIKNETGWLTVPSPFFVENEKNMGMEIAYKKNGKVVKDAPAPAGYSEYIGNKKYGQWKEQDGNSFWSFYGKYAFMTSMFHMMYMPVRYSYWNTYRTGYYGQGRAFYGTTASGNIYGTSGYANNNRTTTTRWNSGRTANFKQKVASRVRSSSSGSKYGSKGSSRYGSGSSSYRGRSSFSFGGK